MALLAPGIREKFEKVYERDGELGMKALEFAALLLRAAKLSQELGLPEELFMGQARNVWNRAKAG